MFCYRTSTRALTTVCVNVQQQMMSLFTHILPTPNLSVSVSPCVRQLNKKPFPLSVPFLRISVSRVGPETPTKLALALLTFMSVF